MTEAWKLTPIWSIIQSAPWLLAGKITCLPVPMQVPAERRDGLIGYQNDGRLEIDNHLVENPIRPVALGRKNYLFAGSHEGARRAAMAYSSFATCKAHQVNPHQWLKHVLENIMSTKYNNVRDLYPQNFKTNM